MENSLPKDHGQAAAGQRPAHIEVSVFTTSGVFPRHGHEDVRPTEIVDDVLRKAAHALHLTDTSGWVVTSDGREIDAAASFAQNGLAGTVELHWGPREGGGGC
jgi:hypothetical protein